MFCQHVDHNQHYFCTITDIIENLDKIAKWILVNLKKEFEFELFIDLDSFQPLAMIFDSLHSSGYCNKNRKINYHARINNLPRIKHSIFEGIQTEKV